MSWTPSPQLAGAVRRALTHLQVFYPRSLQMATQSTEAAQAWVSSYCRAFLGHRVSLTTIDEAAERWPAEHGKETPFPKEFAAFCAEIERELHPALPRETPAPVAAPVPRPKHADAVEAMSHRAYAVLRDWALVSECWAVAWEAGVTDALREDVRLGRVPEEAWGTIISEVPHGRVARTPGPMSGSLRRRAA